MTPIAPHKSMVDSWDPRVKVIVLWRNQIKNLIFVSLSISKDKEISLLSRLWDMFLTKCFAPREASPPCRTYLRFFQGKTVISGDCYAESNSLRWVTWLCICIFLLNYLSKMITVNRSVRITSFRPQKDRWATIGRSVRPIVAHLLQAFDIGYN